MCIIGSNMTFHQLNSHIAMPHFVHASCAFAMFFVYKSPTHTGNSIWFTRPSNRIASHFVTMVVTFNHSWSKMHVFDVLIMLQLLVLNIYARVMLDKINNFWSENGQNLPNFLLPNMFAVNLPNFPATKVSLHTV